MLTSIQRFGLARLSRDIARVCILGIPLIFGGFLGQPASAEGIRVGVPALPPGKGNPYTGCCLRNMPVWSAFFEYVTAIDSAGRTQPFLATEWENLEPSTWRFRVRENVVFSNGERLNAGAIKATLDWLTSEAGRTSLVGRDLNRVIASSRVVDGSTLEITTKSPNPSLPKFLAIVAVVAPAAWRDLGLAEFASRPVASGPYEVGEWTEAEVLATINPTSWRPQKDVSQITFIGLPDSAARSQAIISGQIDVNTLINEDEVPGLKAARLQIHSSSSGRTFGIAFITANENSPFRDVRLRRAANYAVNKQAIIDGIFGGNGRVASQAGGQAVIGYNPDIEPYPYDPEKARQLLAEAGYADGVDLKMEAITSETQTANVYLAAVQDLNAVGIRAELNSIVFPDFLKKFIGVTFPDDVWAFGLGHDNSRYLDAALTLSTFYSCLKRPPFYCNEAATPLLESALGEFDPAKRVETIRRLMKMVHDNASHIFLAERLEHMAYAPKIKNFRNVHFHINYHELEIEQ